MGGESAVMRLMHKFKRSNEHFLLYLKTMQWSILSANVSAHALSAAFMIWSRRRCKWKRGIEKLFSQNYLSERLAPNNQRRQASFALATHSPSPLYYPPLPPIVARAFATVNQRTNQTVSKPTNQPAIHIHRCMKGFMLPRLITALNSRASIWLRRRSHRPEAPSGVYCVLCVCVYRWKVFHSRAGIQSASWFHGASLCRR